MAKEYREKVEKELREICRDVLVSCALALTHGCVVAAPTMLRSRRVPTHSTR